MMVTDRTTLPARAAADRSAPWALALAALLLAAVAGAVAAPTPRRGM